MIRDTLALVWELGKFTVSAGYLLAWQDVESRLARCTGRWEARHPRGVLALLVGLSLNVALFLWRRAPLVGTVAYPIVNKRAADDCGCDGE